MKNQLLILLFIGISTAALSQINEAKLYNLNTNLESRAISFENPTGAPGAAGTAASEIGVGRKGAPNKLIKANEEVVLCNIKESGTIRHIWMAGEFMELDWMSKSEGRKKLLRSLVIRVYWDGQEYPSIECPLGDFMGLAHSKITSYQSAIHSIGEKGALNFWLHMPFARSARMTLTNESDVEFHFYYQIDYTINDEHNDDIGRLHVSFRRQSPTTQKVDFEILPKRQGKGRFIGAVLGIRTLYPGWWGEGEIKFFMDGDTEYPTLCGTGSEDYVGLSYGIQETTFLNHGCNLNFKSDSISPYRDYKTNEIKDMNREYISMYRWHIADPIYWKKDIRVIIQQIGCCYYEREDDWSAAAFWYEPIPSEPLPKLPLVEERIKNLDELLMNKK